MTNVGSPPDLSSENKISLIEEAVKVIYDLRSSAPHQPMRIMCGVLQSLEISLIKVKEEWERTEVGKLEATIQRLKERDLELRAVIAHMADQLIGRVPIKPVESAKAKDALIVDLQHRYNDLNDRLKEATNHVGELVVVRNDLQKANAMYEMRIKEWQARNEQLVKDNADLRNKAVPNSDLIKANAKLTKERDDLKARVGDDKIKELYRENTELRFLHNENAEINHLRKTNTDLVGKLEELRAENNDLRMQVEHLEGEVEPNEQIEKLRQANADLIETRRSLIEDRDRRHEAAQSECLKKEHAIEQLEMAKKELADRKVMIGDLKGKVEALDNMIATRDSRIQSLLEENVELSKAVELHKALDGDGIAYREANVADLMEQLEDAERLITEQHTELGELGDKVTRLQKEKASADKSVDNLFKENDAQEETINRLQAEINEMAAQLSNLQNLIARPDLAVPFIRSIDKIAKERDEAQASNKALSSVGESMFEENEALRKQNKELQETVITLQNQNNDLVAAQTRDMQRMTDRVREVEQHNDYLQTAIVRDAERVGVRIKGLEYEKRRLEVELGAKHSDIKELHKIIEEFRTNNEDLHKLVDELKERNAKLEEQCHDCKEVDMITSRDDKIKKLKGQIESLESELKARDVEFAKRGKRIEDLRTTAEQQGEEIKQLEFRLDTKIGDINGLIETDDEQKQEIESLKGKLAVADKEIDLLKEQLSPDVYGKLAEKDQRIHELLLAGEEMEKELKEALAYKDKLIEGIAEVFDGDIPVDNIERSLNLLMTGSPAVKEAITRDFKLLDALKEAAAYRMETAELEQRKQAAVDMIKKAAPGAWKVVGARPLHDNEDGGDNEEASPEKEESRES